MKVAWKTKARTVCPSLVKLRSDDFMDHKQKQRAVVTAKLESYEDLEARMEHMDSLIQGNFDEEPGRAMTRAEWDAIAEDSAKKASDARELLRLKKC